MFGEVLLTRLEHGEDCQGELGSGLARDVELVLDHDLLCDSSDLGHLASREPEVGLVGVELEIDGHLRYQVC